MLKDIQRQGRSKKTAMDLPDGALLKQAYQKGLDIQRHNDIQLLARLERNTRLMGSYLRQQDLTDDVIMEAVRFCKKKKNINLAQRLLKNFKTEKTMERPVVSSYEASEI